MATDIVVPTLGESVSEATVAQWLKKPGEAVAVDEPLVELETDKVTLEVNAERGRRAGRGPGRRGRERRGRRPARADRRRRCGALPPRSGAGDRAAPEPAPAAANSGPEPSATGTPPAPAPAPAAAPAVAAVEIDPGAEPGRIGDRGDGGPMAEAARRAAVAQDEPLVELETDKVTLEVNAPAAGVLQKIRAETGATVEVGRGARHRCRRRAAPAPAPSPEAAGPRSRGRRRKRRRCPAANGGLDPGRPSAHAQSCRAAVSPRPIC